MNTVRVAAAVSFLVGCIACATGVVRVTDEAGHTIRWNLSSQVDGKMFVAAIDPVEVEKTPEWDPHGPVPPPLTTLEASHLAWIEARIYLTDPTEWEPTSINLYRLQASKWAWVVTWKPINASSDDVLQIPILLSGHPVTLKEVEVDDDASDREEIGQSAF